MDNNKGCAAGIIWFLVVMAISPILVLLDGNTELLGFTFVLSFLSTAALFAIFLCSRKDNFILDNEKIHSTDSTTDEDPRHHHHNTCDNLSDGDGGGDW
jgi:hypothetical protein